MSGQLRMAGHLNIMTRAAHYARFTVVRHKIWEDNNIHQMLRRSKEVRNDQSSDRDLVDTVVASAMPRCIVDTFHAWA